MRDDRLLAERIPIQFGGYPSLPHDEHAVGQPDDFGQLGRDDDDGFAFGRQLLDQAVDLRLGSDVDSRVGSSKRRICEPAAIQREMIAFCWLPPLNRRIGRSS